MVTNPNSRFSKVDIALRSPGECFLLKTPDGPFIDTKLDWGIDGRPPFRGRVYLSVAAVREMAEEAGLFDEYQAANFKALDVAAKAHAEGYRQGYAEGQEEIDRDDTQLLDLLRDLADRLPQRDRAAVEATVAAVEGARDAVQDAPGNPFLVALPSVGDAGEGAGAGGKQRPAGVSGNPSHGGASAVQ